MSGDSAVERVAEAGSDIVVAGVTAVADGREGRSSWSNNKVLLAVLPPTLALASVALGIWDNGNRDRASAAAAREAAREAAAQQLEAEQQAQELRLAALVLPKYEALLSDVHDAANALNQCSTDIGSWQVQRDEWTGTQIAPPLAVGLNPDGSAYVGGLAVGGSPFLESCAAIDATIPPLRLSLDEALLVSGSDLGSAASGLVDGLVVAAETARHLRAAVPPDASFIDPERTDQDGRTFYEVVEVLTTQLAESDAAAERLIDAVRDVQLLTDQP